MGKHLIQKEKKESGIKIPELKFPKFSSFNDKKSSDAFGENKAKIKLPVRKASGSGVAGIVISALLLILISIAPLEGWMLKLAYAIILFIASTELIWDLIDNIREKEYFSYENLILLSVILAYAIAFEFEAVLLALLYRFLPKQMLPVGKSLSTFQKLFQKPLSWKPQKECWKYILQMSTKER